MKRLLLAAEKGDARSQFNLGVLHDNRLDDNEYPIENDRKGAIKWLLKAAQQGLPRAQSRLAQIYASGPETSEDIIKACTWFILATTSLSGIHRQMAQSGYERISSQMTPAQIAEATRDAKNWKPKSQDDVARPKIRSGGRE
jgi:TPR repeat protein